METPDPKYKHKPSQKHTLEEVLKSLQDLIRNDLAESAVAAGRTPSASAESRQHQNTAAAVAETKPRREVASGVREDFAAVSPGSGPVNLDAVMRSLKDLIGNELNVGNEPKAPETAAAPVHQEYLAEDDKIEEYVPEEIRQLEDALGLGDEPVAPPPAEPLAPDEIVAESPPQEFAPLDEELTFEESAEVAPPPPVLSETPELPGEISPEMFAEAEAETEAAPPPAISDPAPPAAQENAAPGIQQELFLEEPPSIVLRVPPPMKTKTTMEPEPAPAPQPPVAASVDEATEKADQTLPTIEVEENFDAENYFNTAPPAEDPPASEEIIDLGTEISGAPETPPPAAEATPAPPVEEKITLEIASEPEIGSAQKSTSVDFDAIDFEPSQPEQAPPPAESPESETPKITEAVPVAQETESAPEQSQPAAPAGPAATEAPGSQHLDDIPVLNEVVAPPAGSVPTVKPSAPPLPAPDRARDIVVRAVAKLNVEMRKSGGAGLDTKTILRLQQLIRQELEKGGKK